MIEIYILYQLLTYDVMLDLWQDLPVMRLLTSVSLHLA